MQNSASCSLAVRLTCHQTICPIRHTGSRMFAKTLAVCLSHAVCITASKVHGHELDDELCLMCRD